MPSESHTVVSPSISTGTCPVGEKAELVVVHRLGKGFDAILERHAQRLHQQPRRNDQLE
jgi:hypothetical protein